MLDNKVDETGSYAQLKLDMLKNKLSKYAMLMKIEPDKLKHRENFIRCQHERSKKPRGRIHLPLNRLFTNMSTLSTLTALKT